MIFECVPENFNPRFEVAGAFVVCEGEMILLQRQDHKPQGNTWGIPSGQIDQGESPLATISREIVEETELTIPQEEIKFFKTVYVKHWEYDLVYHMFQVTLNKKPVIRIRDNEHKSFQWATPELAMTMLLIHDLDDCIRLFFNNRSL